MKKKVAIIGVGLIGGSLGMALKKSGIYHVVGVGRHRNKLVNAKRLKAVDEFNTDFGQGVSGADIVVVCTPVDLIGKMVARILPNLKNNTIVCDVGSVKGPVHDEMKKVFSKFNAGAKNISFVGTHPMAGSEKTGVQFASKDLYKGAKVVITIDKLSEPRSINEIMKMWRITGGLVTVMDSKKHDRAVALISHLPHIIAFTMCNNVASLKDAKQVSGLMAGSFKDITRVADSNPRDWAAICSMNKKEVRQAVDMFISGLVRIRGKLGSLTALQKNFVLANSARQKLFK